MQKVQTVAGQSPQAPVKKNSADTSKSLSDLGVTISRDDGTGRNEKARFAHIGVETNSIRFGFGAVTTSVGIVANPGELIILEGEGEVENFQCISKSAGNAADLMISVEF